VEPPADVCWYAVLGVPTDATKKEIKTTFRDLASELHPDRVADFGEWKGKDVDTTARQLAQQLGAFSASVVKGEDVDEHTLLSHADHLATLVVERRRRAAASAAWEQVAAAYRVVGSDRRRAEYDALLHARELGDIGKAVGGFALWGLSKVAGAAAEAVRTATATKEPDVETVAVAEDVDVPVQGGVPTAVSYASAHNATEAGLKV